jgi:S-DNA-T family DNA segregation ATPase FtsK/SpoIIIE
VQSELDARLLRLLAKRRRKFSRGDGIRPLVLVVDELAYYCTGPDRRHSAEFAQLLRDIVSRGRAPGIIVIAATQKPSGDTVPTYLRDLFGFRWALRCSTPQASDTILGAGWASMGYSAATIDSAERGVGFLLHEGERPVRLRTCYLSDDDRDVLGRRAEHQRAVTRESPS